MILNTLRKNWEVFFIQIPFTWDEYYNCNDN